MSGETLVLFGGDEPSAPIGWARVDGAGAIVAHGMADASVPSAPAERTALILPGADAQVKRLELPARTDAQARAAAPYLFEGALVAQEAMHYAIGEAQDAAGNRLVAAMSEVRLTQWLERCRVLGADPYNVALDFTLWPTAPGEIEIIETRQRTLVAGGLLGGFSIEPALAPSLFGRWLAALHHAPGLVWISGGDPQAWASRLGSSASTIRTRPVQDATTILARAAADAPDYVPNLRQGAFAPQTRRATPLRLWRFAAALALLALLLQIGSLLVSGWRDQQAAAATMAAAERDFRAARPDVQSVVNLRAQVAALVNAMEQSGAHPVLAVTDPLIGALQTQPLARVDELRHEAPGNIVRLRLSSPQAPPLEAVAVQLREQGLSVESRNLQPVEGRYTVELVLERAP